MVMTLLDCILSVAIIGSPLFYPAYTLILNIFDVMNDWVRGEDGHS